MERNPIQLSKAEALSLTLDNVKSVKRLDCTFYNECLTTARNGHWKGFGCSQCSAYQAIDVEQRVQDMLGMQAAMEAAENEERDGCAGRKRGVRPGADARVRHRLKLVPEEPTIENPATVPAEEAPIPEPIAQTG